MLIPYTDVPGVEHEYALTIYTDVALEIERIDPSKVFSCTECTNAKCYHRMVKKLEKLEAKYALVEGMEAEVRRREYFGKPKVPSAAAAPPPPTAAAAAAPPAAAAARPRLGGPLPADLRQDEMAAHREFFGRADTDGDGRITGEDAQGYGRSMQQYTQRQQKSFDAALDAARAEAAAHAATLAEINAAVELLRKSEEAAAVGAAKASAAAKAEAKAARKAAKAKAKEERKARRKGGAGATGGAGSGAESAGESSADDAESD